MLNCVYRLVSPRIFGPVEVDLVLPGEAHVVVRPSHLSICNADMRYYLGNRSAAAMAKKLPMALIHEGIGVVVSDTTGNFSQGDRVVMLPNDPVEEDAYIAENYLPSSRFCGSGYDGFMQEYVVLPEHRVVKLPDSIDLNIAAFTEMVSVAVHAVSRFEAIAHDRRDVLGVWGDGNLGFLVSLVLRIACPSARIIVFGHNSFKLNDFTFVDETRTVEEQNSVVPVDHAFECCGGRGCVSAIDQIIDCIRPEGTISLLGVSEDPVAINTRMVLEKGLRMYGSSRSTRSDFERAAEMYQEHPEAIPYLSSLVGNVVKVESLSQIVKAFNLDAQKSMGKTIMQWCI